MEFKPNYFDAPLKEYQRQVQELLDAHHAGDSEAIRILHQNHPRFLDSKTTWLPKNLSDSEIQSAALDLADSQLALARCYSFLNWAALAEYVEAVTRDGTVFHFESAVEAVINGDVASLESLLRANPELVRARSTRKCHFYPPVHRATLLHYIAANGVEGYRQ